MLKLNFLKLYLYYAYLFSIINIVVVTLFEDKKENICHINGIRVCFVLRLNYTNKNGHIVDMQNSATIFQTYFILIPCIKKGK